MAIWFKELPGHVQKLRLAEVAQSLDIAVRGFDLIKSEMEPLRCREAQENLQTKLAAIDLLDAKRIESFKKNLVDIQQTGKGVIFVVGKFHYEKLVRAFSEDHSLDNEPKYNNGEPKWIKNSFYPKFMIIRSLIIQPNLRT